MIVEAFDEKTARTWLFGINTRLDDQAPITVLRQTTSRSSLQACGRQCVRHRKRTLSLIFHDRSWKRSNGDLSSRIVKMQEE